MALKRDIAELVLEKRPHLSKSSVATYSGLVSSMLKKLKKESAAAINESDNYDEFLENIKTLTNAQSRKTLSSALFVLTEDKRFRDVMIADQKAVNEFYRSQEYTDKRREKLISFERVNEIHDELKRKYKSSPTASNTMDLLISYLYSGTVKGLEPRRTQDVALMKIRNSTDADNYVDWKTKRFVYNIYKTKAKYGTQKVDIPPEVMKILTKWKTQNQSDYLLFSQDGEPLTTSALSKRVSKLFDGNGVDLLRSIFLSHYYKDIPALKEMQKVAGNMGHDFTTAIEFYVKKGDPESG